MHCLVKENHTGDGNQEAQEKLQGIFYSFAYVVKTNQYSHIVSQKARINSWEVQWNQSFCVHHYPRNSTDC